MRESEQVCLLIIAQHVNRNKVSNIKMVIMSKSTNLCVQPQNCLQQSATITSDNDGIHISCSASIPSFSHELIAVKTLLCCDCLFDFPCWWQVL